MVSPCCEGSNWRATSVGLVATLLHHGSLCCGANAALDLQYLDAIGASCNDGTRPAYYLARGDPKLFLVWLEGGGDCGSKDACDRRHAESQEHGWQLMTSTGLSQSREMGGIFSDSAQDNRLFANATKVFVHYCSSDGWTGDRAEKAFGYYFQGHRILVAVLRELESEHGLDTAGMLVLGGCSAGGRGALYNLDRACSALSNRSTLCRGVLDAAWWVPEHDGTLMEEASHGFAVWNASGLLAPCVSRRIRSNLTGPHVCLFGPEFAPHVLTPFLVQEEQFDYFLLGKKGVHRPVFSWGSDAWERAVSTRDLIRDTLSTLSAPNAAFSAACWGHCLAQSNNFFTVRVAEGNEHLSMEEAVRLWLTGEHHGPQVHLDDCLEPNCSKGCPFAWTITVVFRTVLATVFLVMLLGTLLVRYIRRQRTRC